MQYIARTYPHSTMKSVLQDMPQAKPDLFQLFVKRRQVTSRGLFARVLVPFLYIPNDLVAGDK
jgi:hypothetical protein